MPKSMTRKLAVAATLLAMAAPTMAFAQTGTDPEPRLFHVMLSYLGIAW